MKAIYLFFLLFLGCGCICNAQTILSAPIPDNPTSWFFKMKIKDVDSIFYISRGRYGDERLYIHDFFYHKPSERVNERPDAAIKALAGEDNKYDIWMELSVNPSVIYYNKKNERSFGYEMTCIAHFTAIDSNTTKMEIRVVKAQVHVRDRWLPSPPHFVNNPVYKTVKPTTIEEYECLQMFGRYLGVINQMPALKL